MEGDRMNHRPEMTLDELIADPLVRMLMASDRVDAHDLRQTAREVRIRMISFGQERREPERPLRRTGEVPTRRRSNIHTSSAEAIRLVG
jgi:hypothetical protein